MSRNILIIEDDMPVRDLYESVLTKAGYEVKTAIDGLQGSLAASEIPDLILLDIMLPKLDGVSLLKQLKANDDTKNISVILLTNLAQDSIMKECYDLGAEGYLIKAQHMPSEIVGEVDEFFLEKEKTESEDNG